MAVIPQTTIIMMIIIIIIIIIIIHYHCCVRYVVSDNPAPLLADSSRLQAL